MIWISLHINVEIENNQENVAMSILLGAHHTIFTWLYTSRAPHKLAYIFINFNKITKMNSELFIYLHVTKKILQQKLIFQKLKGEINILSKLSK